jgi:hypothetical protein
VVAYEHGWQVKRGGVRIDTAAEYEIGTANLSGVSGLFTSVSISMPGLLAKEKFDGVRWRRTPPSICARSALGKAKSVYSPWGGPTNLRAIALAFTSHLDPNTTHNVLHQNSSGLQESDKCAA